MTPTTCPNAKLICIRVENASDLSFEKFTIQFSGQSEQYGPLAAGQVSDYRNIEEAYSYAYTEAFSDQRRFLLQPIDFVGEKTLRPGSYTYRYTVVELEEPQVNDDWILHGYMSVRLIADED